MPERAGTQEDFSSEFVRPIERPNLNQQILLHLVAYLERAHLKTGSKLPPERQLARMLHVSRPSVREVLRALTILGLLKPRQGKGTYLVGSPRSLLSRQDHAFTLEEHLDLGEVAEARFAIEPIIASLAAERASEAEIAGISAELQSMCRNLNDREAFIEHDLQFHTRMLDACGNAVLRKIMRFVYENLSDYRRRIAQYGDLKRVVKLHESIVDALRRHDPRAARMAMTRHMRFMRLTQTRLKRQKDL